MPSRSTGSDKKLCFVVSILGLILYSGVSSLHPVVMVPVIQLMEQILNEFKKYNMDGISIMKASKTTDSNKEGKMLFVNDSQLCTAYIIISKSQYFMDNFFDNDGKNVDSSHLKYMVVNETDRISNTARIYKL